MKNKPTLLLEIVMYAGIVPLVLGLFTFSSDKGKILTWIGFLLTVPNIVINDSKNYKNLTPIERVRLIGIIVLLPLLIFGFIYFLFFR